MASLCGLSVEQFWKLYHRDRLELDRGTLSTDEYWGRILRTAGQWPAPDLIARVEEEDARGWTRINHAVVAWAAELRAAGYLTAVLSNMPADKLRYMRERPEFDFLREFSVTLFSCDYLLVKPEREIYDTCRRLLGRLPGECLFLDDSPANVEGGRAAGLHAMLFTGVADALPQLQQAWKLPVRSLLNGSAH